MAKQEAREVSRPINKPAAEPKEICLQRLELSAKRATPNGWTRRKRLSLDFPKLSDHSTGRDTAVCRVREVRRVYKARYP